MPPPSKVSRGVHNVVSTRDGWSSALAYVKVAFASSRLTGQANAAAGRPADREPRQASRQAARQANRPSECVGKVAILTQCIFAGSVKTPRAARR